KKRLCRVPGAAETFQIQMKRYHSAAICWHAGLGFQQTFLLLQASGRLELEGIGLFAVMLIAYPKSSAVCQIIDNTVHSSALGVITLYHPCSASHQCQDIHSSLVVSDNAVGIGQRAGEQIIAVFAAHFIPLLIIAGG